ncbi:uncharacterized protein GGS22DRAFT_193121 [Annulohypoxylon maeteangense]|uniref:uncharacterized protein n=1 Tax=Annulohypoxylon maeteangense TaxID=1927788 RepID=UPI0020078CBE|nr:uncharacterized protein GGS22DRAFT_193121 [Annulohypoxylon maeteangense]KAI0880543.1 hypothetical protein GGS22DRAFT_193121 [Annulohypoxylon maeteangense]
MAHRRPCACKHCQCRSHAQEPDHYYNSELKPSSRALTPTLCLVCERVELWGKNDPTYRGCNCTCKCKLERENGSTLCGDCGEQNRLNPRRHRPHGESRRKVEGA